MHGSERNFVIWWNCAINVRFVRQDILKGVVGVKSDNKVRRCY